MNSGKGVLRILIKMPNWVGDCIMATPAIALLKAAIPNCEIHALCRYPVSQILETNPHISRLIQADDRKLPADTREELKSNHYDAALLFTNSVRPAWLMLRAGVRKRIGFARGLQKILLTHRLAFDPLEWQTPVERKLSKRAIKGVPQPGRPRHLVMYYLRIVEECVRVVAPEVNLAAVPSDFKLVLPVSNGSRRRVRELLREHQLAGKTLIGLNPGAAHGPSKRWPPERLGHVANALARPDYAFVTTASKHESALTDLVASTSSQKIHRL
jgi:heptosyltransferase-2